MASRTKSLLAEIADKISLAETYADDGALETASRIFLEISVSLAKAAQEKRAALLEAARTN